MKAEDTGIVVLIDIFSGRPNPMWSLSKTDIEKIKKLLAELPSVKPRNPFGLGYRGFVIMNTGVEKQKEPVPDFPMKIRVYNGVLAILDEGGWMHKADANKIEDWLLNKAREMSKEQKLGLEKILPAGSTVPVPDKKE